MGVMMVRKNQQEKNRFPSVTLVLIFASVVMIAHGLRMMVQGIFYPTSYYPAPLPTRLDFWFDWCSLFVLGALVLGIAMKRWMRWIHQPKTS